MNLNKKLKNLLKNYFLNKKKYFLNFLKLINFSKKNMNIINYNIFFNYFENLNIKDLSKIFKILKKFKINIIEEIPNKNNILYKDFYNNFLNKNYFKNDFKNFKNIENLLKRVFKILKKNIFIFTYFLKKEKNFFENLFKINFKKNLFFKKFKNLNINFENNSINFYYSIKNFKKIFYKPIIFFLKLLKKKKRYKKICIRIIKDKLNLINNFNIKFFNYIYKLFKKIFKKIEKLKLKIFDSIINISNINYFKFSLFFLKNNSNLNWIFNLVNLSNFKKNLKDDFYFFIKKNEKKLKNIEKKYSTKIKDILKLFSILEIENLKLSLIKEEILNSNLNLVKQVTKKYFKKNLYEDYIQEGVVGLMKSINEYDYRFKIFFKNFAVLSIKQNISKYFYKNNNLLKIPFYLITLIRKVNKEKQDYYKIYKEKPNLKYLSKKLNISETKIKNIINLYKYPKSIEKVLKDDMKISDFIKDEKNINFEDSISEKTKNENFIKNLKNLLDENSIKILFMRFGIDNEKKSTLLKIGEKFNLSKERVRQIQNNILNKLRHPSKIKFFKKFFSIKN